MTSEKSERGFKIMEQMIGAEKAASVRDAAESDSFGAPLIANILESCFADVWGREVLSRRERSLVTLGVLIARGATFELGTHVEVALRHGLTAEEIEEIALQTMPYAGLLSAFHAINVARDKLKSLGQLNETGIWASMDKVLNK